MCTLINLLILFLVVKNIHLCLSIQINILRKCFRDKSKTNQTNTEEKKQEQTHKPKYMSKTENIVQ